MAVVLFGWEMGGGLGHLARLVPVAKKLADAGHRPIFAVRHLRETSQVLEAELFGVLQAPFCRLVPSVGGKCFKAATYADLLARYLRTRPIFSRSCGPGTRCWIWSVPN